MAESEDIQDYTAIQMVTVMIVLRDADVGP